MLRLFAFRLSVSYGWPAQIRIPIPGKPLEWLVAPYLASNVQFPGFVRHFSIRHGNTGRLTTQAALATGLGSGRYILSRINSWRREWDSNPRYSLKYTRFPSVRLKPLGHLSVGQSAF